MNSLFDARMHYIDQPNDSSDRLAEDALLARRLADKDATAWQSFFERYSGLIYTVVRRKLFAEDEDEVRTVFADVLHKLHGGKIAEYSGRAPLSAWLIVVARGMALDYLRHRDGRDQPPDGYGELSDLEQEVFKLRYVDGVSLEVIIHVLGERGCTVEESEFVDIFARIEARVGKRYLHKVEHDMKAGSVGVDSGRLLRYLLYVKASREREGSSTPLNELLYEEEIESKAERVREMLAQLSPEEQTVMKLRFIENLDAGTVARLLSLGDPRRVYGITRRAVNKLRRGRSR